LTTVNTRQEFLQALELPQLPYCVELGVLHGDFSKMILEYLNPCYLYLIDPFEKNYTKYKNGLTTAYSTRDEYFLVRGKFSGDQRVVLRKGYSYDLVHTFKNHYFDFIYHDASHLYKDVLKDLVEWFPKLKKGGIIAGHDYIKHEDFGVIEAVEKFCDLFAFEMFLLNKDGGDYALRKT